MRLSATISICTWAEQHATTSSKISTILYSTCRSNPVNDMISFSVDFWVNQLLLNRCGVLEFHRLWYLLQTTNAIWMTHKRNSLTSTGKKMIFLESTSKGLSPGIKNILLWLKMLRNTRFLILLLLFRCISLVQGSPTWCPRAPGRPQGTCRSPAGLFWK